MMGGEDEMELVKDLPEGLRRDIKRFLCLDLIKKVQYKVNSNFPCKNTKLVQITSGNILMVWISLLQVPLFHNLDDLILDNICDRVKPLVFSKDEKVLPIRAPCRVIL